MSELSKDELRLLDALLDEAFDLESAALPAFLDERCPAGLRPKIERMLASVGLEASTAGLATGGAFGSALMDDVAGDLGLRHGEFEAGHRIGPYRITGRLGRGGMGHVYSAERADGQFAQRVALKLADIGRGNVEQIQRRFALERQILAGLDHPNIARLLDGGVLSDGRPWFAMEVVEGEPLDRYCERREFDLERRLRLFATVARTVASAHRKLVVHRDLKPSNILVTEDGMVKLLDFGIAKLLDESLYGEDAAGITRTLQMVLTPEYAAPEQFLGEPVTTATDVYQLGVLLYELLVGRRPFDIEGLSRVQVQLKVCTEAPTRPSVAATELDHGSMSSRRRRRRLEGDLDTVVMKALRHEPERRYLSADDLADDVDRFLAGHPISARPDTLRYRAHKFVRRHVGAVTSSIAALIVIVGLVVFYTVELRAQRDLARREAVRANLVSDFLTEVFDSADPYRNRGEEPTARALLEAGTRRLAALEGEPEAHADLSHLIGRVHARLGDYDAARPLLNQALDERRAAQGEASPQVADTLYELALVFEQTGDYEGGLEIARQVLELRQQAVHPKPRQLAKAWNRVAYLERHLLHYDEAWEAGQKALAFLDEGTSAENREGGDGSLRLEVLSGLGYVAQRRGEQTEALELFLKAQSLSEGWSDEQRRHPDVARVYRNLGSIYGRLGEQAKARRAHEASLAVYEQVLPTDHPELAGLLINMGEGYVIDEEPDRAVPILERAFQICRKHLGEDHLHTALALINLSNARSMLGQHAEALELQDRAKGILARTVGEDHPMYVHALGFGGELLRRAGDAHAALDLQNEALARAEVVFGPDHPELTQILEEQARTLEDLGRFRDAAASVRRQLAVRAPHLPEDSEVPARLSQRAEDLEARAGAG